MNKKIKIAIGIISLILITGFLIYPLYINNSVENTIKNYYETRDKHKNIDEYNSLVVSKSKLENLDSIPDIVEKREFLDIKEINPEDYELIKSDLERGIYSDKEKNINFI